VTCTTYRARMNLTVDFRTQSDYGTIRAYAAIVAQQSIGDFAPAGFNAQANGSAGIFRAFIQFAGFTVGHAVSYFDFMNGADYGYVPALWAPGTGVNGTDLIAYTWLIGNGVSASIDIEDAGNAQNNPLSALGGTIAPDTGTLGHGPWQDGDQQLDRLLARQRRQRRCGRHRHAALDAA
jgi:Porin subfamily